MEIRPALRDRLPRQPYFRSREGYAMRHCDPKVPISAAVLMTLALNLHADPIQDGALASYRAGWFANADTCAETCKAKAPGSLAEYEASAVPHTKRAFVCR